MTYYLGKITEKYEGGPKGPFAIGKTPGDPGGASYGIYQLAGKTLRSFLRMSGYAPKFMGAQPGTPEFDKTFVSLTKSDPDFPKMQRLFIIETHYKPTRGYANSLGVMSTPAVDEAIFSMSVQHGKAKDIIKGAGITSRSSEELTIRKLYDARREYVRGLKLSPKIKTSLMNRYDREFKDVMELVCS